MLVKNEARIMFFPGTDFHFPSTSVPPGTFLGSDLWTTVWNGQRDAGTTHEFTARHGQRNDMHLAKKNTRHSQRLLSKM